MKTAANDLHRTAEWVYGGLWDALGLRPLAQPESAGGYMNRWAWALTGNDIDRLVDSLGNAPGATVPQLSHD